MRRTASKPTRHPIYEGDNDVLIRLEQDPECEDDAPLLGSRDAAINRQSSDDNGVRGNWKTRALKLWRQLQLRLVAVLLYEIMIWGIGYLVYAPIRVIGLPLFTIGVLIAAIHWHRNGMLHEKLVPAGHGLMAHPLGP